MSYSNSFPNSKKPTPNSKQRENQKTHPKIVETKEKTGDFQPVPKKDDENSSKKICKAQKTRLNLPPVLQDPQKDPKATNLQKTGQPHTKMAQKSQK